MSHQWSDDQRAAIDSLAIVHNVPLDVSAFLARRAFRRYRTQCLHPRSWFKLLEAALARHPRRPVASVRRQRGGAASNVVKCSFKLYGPNQGIVAAQVMTLDDVRDELRQLRRKGLREVVAGKMIANDNDPAFEQSHYFTKVQAAWVRRTAERWAGAAP